MPPLEWALGDTIAEWYPLDLPEGAGGFKIQLTRGAASWESPLLPLE
jgi:hypothetical protein